MSVALCYLYELLFHKFTYSNALNYDDGDFDLHTLTYLRFTHNFAFLDIFDWTNHAASLFNLSYSIN